MTVNEIRQQRAEHWERMKSFLNSHQTKDGRLSVDDTATYENMEAKMKEFDAAVHRAEEAERIEAELRKPVTSPLTGTPGGKSGSGRASDEYNSAFLNYIRSRVASNALQVGTDSEGGYLVPVEFEKMLYAARDKVDPIFRLAGRITLGSMTKDVPYVASEGAAALIAEEGAYGDTDDSFGKVTFHAYKFGRICKASEELIEDSAFDIKAHLAQSLGKAVGKCQAGYYWTGTGSSQPQGVMTAAGTGVTAAAADKITADEIIDLFYSVPQEERANASFAMNDSTVAQIRKLKLGTGEYLWKPGLDGQGDRILGKPFVTSAYIDAIGASKKVIAFGDFEAYFKIADRTGFEFRVLDQLYAANGQIGFRGRARSDSRGILASNGIKILKMHA